MNSPNAPPTTTPPTHQPNPSRRRQCRQRRDNTLAFSPLAWLKLQLFLHAGDTEVGGFGISSENDLLHIQDFVTLEQVTSSVTVEFTDNAVANHFDQCVDAGLPPARFARIWCHTHPGSSPDPSVTDEETFARVFGRCDWAVMFILSRTGRTYARLSLCAGPGSSVLLPVTVDWADWPNVVTNEQARLPELLERWMNEFDRNIQPYEPVAPVRESKPGRSTPSPLTSQDWWDAYCELTDKQKLDDLDRYELTEELEVSHGWFD